MEEESNVPPKVSPFAILALLFFIGCGFFLVLKSFFSAKATETKPGTTPTNAGTENHGKPTVVPAVSDPIPPISVEIPTSVFAHLALPLTKAVAESPQQPQRGKRNRIAREDMANIFDHGSRKLTLNAAVSALKDLGFSKSAAYEALLPDGRFSAWLQFAPDGLITWNNL